MKIPTIPPTPTKPRNRPIRVLIVDDSPLIRNILTTMLADASDIQVVGQAANGQEAVRMTMRLKPDVLTLDIRMPQMDGLNATRHIMNVIPTPIVVVANSVYSADYNIAFSAIEAGALTVIEKPRGLGTSDYETVRAELLMALRTMSGVKLIRRMPATVRSDETGPMTSMLLSLYTHSIQVVAIGSSTGGPGVLKQIFSSLPKDFSIPIAVVQHITPAFATGMADWLNSSSNLQVSVPIEGERLMPGKIFMAPAGAHLTIGAGGFIHLDYSEPVKGLRPSASRLFSSVASAFGDDSIGIIMTGMGDDGVDGLVSLSKAGAHVIAQDEVSSVVFGMNKTAIERGIVDEVLSPEGIITRLTKLHRHMQTLSRLK